MKGKHLKKYVKRPTLISRCMDVARTELKFKKTKIAGKRIVLNPVVINKAKYVNLLDDFNPDRI